jgi:hypothetical protein
MSMIATHATALGSMVASHHEFLLRYSKNSKTVFGFVEGKEDPAFYRGFIELLLPDDWDVELWPAGNRDQVYRIHAGLDWRRFPKGRICFFVDRDLSDLIPEALVTDSNIYITDGYSIENSIVNKTMCRRILTEICGFANAEHSDVDDVCELFSKQLEAFYLALIPVMAWILFWRRNAKKANLNDVPMHQLFCVKDGCLKMCPLPKAIGSVADFIHSKCNVVVDPAANQAMLETEIMKNASYRKFARGKYVLWFLVEFCLTARRDIAVLFKTLKTPPPMHVTLSTKNAVAVFGNRARMPSSLRTFLRVNYCKYIERKSVQNSKSRAKSKAKR